MNETMSFATLPLEAARLVRQMKIDHSNFRVGFKGNAKQFLNLMVKRLRMRAGIFYLRQREGLNHLCHTRTDRETYKHSPVDSKELAHKGFVQKEGELSVALLPQHRKDYQKYTTLGVVCFFRDERFSDIELALINELLGLLTDQVVFQIALVNEARHIEFRQTMKRAVQKHSRAGTVIARSMSELVRHSEVRACIIAIVDVNKIYPEYLILKQRKTPKILNGESPFILSPKFFDVFNNKSTALLGSDIEDLNDMMSRYRSQSKFGSNYVIGAFRHEYSVIGMVVLEYDSQKYFEERFVKDIVDEYIEKTSGYVKYLYQRRIGKLIVNPIFKSRETRIQKGQVFVLMPFTQQWSERIWNRILKPAIEEEGFKAMRADDLYGRDIMEDIWSSIVESSFIVADITSRNANVFYELGIAHTVGKPVILITQDIDDIPFDLNRYRHIVYSDDLDGYEELTRQIKSTLLEMKSSTNRQ